MKNIYRAYVDINWYLYYRLYKWQLKIWGDKDYPKVRALIILTLINTSHLVCWIILILFKASFYRTSVMKIAGVLLYFLYTYLNTLIYPRVELERKIELFQLETPEEKQRGTVKMFSYIIVPILVSLIIFFLAYAKRN